MRRESSFCFERLQFCFASIQVCPDPGGMPQVLPILVWQHCMGTEFMTWPPRHVRDPQIHMFSCTRCLILKKISQTLCLLSCSENMTNPAMLKYLGDNWLEEIELGHWLTRSLQALPCLAGLH